MEFLPFISIFVLYFLIAFIKPLLQPKIPFKICSICIAVSITWLALLVAWLLDYSIEPVSIAILMGMSVTGIMYKLEEKYQKKKIRNFWIVRLTLIVGGFYSIFYLLKENWDFLFLTVLSSLFIIAISTLFFQKITHKDVLNEQTGKRKSLLKRLEDCC